MGALGSGLSSWGHMGQVWLLIDELCSLPERFIGIDVYFWVVTFNYYPLRWLLLDYSVHGFNSEYFC